MNAFRLLKNRLVPSGYHERTILAGPLRGIRMYLDLRTQSQFYVGLFEKELHPWIIRFSRGTRSVVDIGAAHGEYTLFALLKTTAERVIAFEPNPDMIQHLQRNIDTNAARSNRLDLNMTFLSGADVQGSVSVSSVLDSILTPCLVKMDIDGGEVDILRAAASSHLQIKGLRWIIETHSLSLEQECVSILSSHGYFTRIVPNAWWRAFLPEQREAQNRWLVATNESQDLVK
jgi:hypothetical protein